MSGIVAWTDQEFSRAVSMWASKHSMGDIARELGKTRSSVGGMMARNREQFPRKDTPGRADGVVARVASKPTRVRHHMTTATARPIVEKTRAPEVPPVLPDEPIIEIEVEPIAAQPVTFLKVTDRQCKWPLWAFPANPGGNGLCCGTKIDLGDTYCRHHRGLSHGKGTRSEQTAVALLEREAAR